MELLVVGSSSLPEPAVLSVRSGASRKQVALPSSAPFKLPPRPWPVTLELLVWAGWSKSGSCLEYVEDGSCKVPLGSRNGCVMSITFRVAPNLGSPSSALPIPDVDGPLVLPKRERKRIEIEEYLQRHGIPDFMRCLIQLLIRERPADPYTFIARKMQEAAKLFDKEDIVRGGKESTPMWADLPFGGLSPKAEVPFREASRRGGVDNVNNKSFAGEETCSFSGQFAPAICNLSEQPPLPAHWQVPSYGYPCGSVFEAVTPSWSGPSLLLPQAVQLPLVPPAREVHAPALPAEAAAAVALASSAAEAALSLPSHSAPAFSNDLTEFQVQGSVGAPHQGDSLEMPAGLTPRLSTFAPKQLLDFREDSRLDEDGEALPHTPRLSQFIPRTVSSAGNPAQNPEVESSHGASNPAAADTDLLFDGAEYTDWQPSRAPEVATLGTPRLSQFIPRSSPSSIAAAEDEAENSSPWTPRLSRFLPDSQQLCQSLDG